MKKLIALATALALAITCFCGMVFSSAAEMPECYFTAQSEDKYSASANALDFEAADGDAYLHVTNNGSGATPTDGNFMPFGHPSAIPASLPVLAMKYRAPGGTGEFFYTQNSLLGAGSPNTYKSIEFENTGDNFTTLVFDFSAQDFAIFGNASFTAADFFRIDTNAMSWFDVAYIAFFANTTDANAFVAAEAAGEISLLKSAEEQAAIPKAYVISPNNASVEFNPFCFTQDPNSEGTYVLKFTVPAGKGFNAIILTGAPTWTESEGCDLHYYLYKFDTDIAASLAGKLLAEGFEDEHPDSVDLKMSFGKLFPAGTYVIKMVADNNKVGGWNGNPDEINYDASFWAYNSQDDSWVDFTATWFPASQIELTDGDVDPLPEDDTPIDTPVDDIPTDNPGTSDVSVIFAILAVVALGGTVILRKKER